MYMFSKVFFLLLKIAPNKIHAYKNSHWCKDWFKTFKKLKKHLSTKFHSSQWGFHPIITRAHNRYYWLIISLAFAGHLVQIHLVLRNYRTWKKKNVATEKDEWWYLLYLCGIGFLLSALTNGKSYTACSACLTYWMLFKLCFVEQSGAQLWWAEDE